VTTSSTPSADSVTPPHPTADIRSPSQRRAATATMTGVAACRITALEAVV
jgi:hypothetical protein